MLRLSHNHLLSIPDIPPLASTLASFDIAHNSVLSLKPLLLNATFVELGDIDISHNNISELTPMMIPQWPRLRSLDIEGNLLETLSDLSRITRDFFLKVMAGNQMTRKYAHTCNLTSHGNELTISPETPILIYNLSIWIKKAWNDISYVDVMKRWFHSLFCLNMQIYLYGNLWHCDVPLSWLIRVSFPEWANTIFDNGNIRLLGSKAVTCAAPSVLKGVKLSDLGELCLDCHSVYRGQT